MKTILEQPIIQDLLEPAKRDQNQQQHGPEPMITGGGYMMRTREQVHPLIQDLLEQGEREHQLIKGQTQRQSGGGHMMRTRAMEVTMKKWRPKLVTEVRSAPPPDVLDIPPPPLLDIPPPPVPSGYPHTDKEWRQVKRYINEQINYNWKEITKLKKQKKVVQQRTVRQNNNQMTAKDAAELKRLTSEITLLRKTLQNWRKRSWQHNILMMDAEGAGRCWTRSRNLWPGRRPEQSSPLDLSVPRPVTRLLEIEDY